MRKKSKKKNKIQKINNINNSDNIINTNYKNNSLSRNSENNDSEESSGEENFLQEESNLKQDISNNIHEIHNEVNCYIMTDSVIIEGNLNHISILTNIIKTYDKLFNLNLKYNYSFNTSASNMKIEHLPCIYNNGKIINKNEIYNFFAKTIEYNRSNELKKENNNNINLIECDLLKNMIINDFQSLINYINYHKNKNVLGNSLRFLIQPYKKLNGLWADYKEIKSIEKKFNILSKSQAIDKIREINGNIEEYIRDNYDIHNNIIYINDFLILIYTYFKTQMQFFGAQKMKKYRLNLYQNINELIRIIDDGLNKNIYEGHKKSFKPEVFFNELNVGDMGGEKNNLKFSNAVINKEKYMKQPVPEENTNFRLTNKLILQGIGYASFFGFMYYLKNKII